MSTPNSGFRLFLFKVTTTLNMTMPGCVRSSLPRGRRSAFPAPAHPQQNGKAERILRTINDCIRTLLLSQCSTSLVLGRGTEHGNVPHQPAAMSRHRPGHAAPPTPRCSATLRRAPRLRTPLLPNTSATTRHKLSPRSVACVFLGYPTALLRHCHRPRLHVTTCDVRGARLPVP